MSATRDPIAPGDVIAEKYAVERLLGRGGMGIVVAARHIELDQPVAIKVLREGVLDGDEATLRFMQEARALAKLGGEHVVRVSDVGRLPSGVPFMVMEHLEGSDLSAVLRARGRLAPEEVADYLIQACAGLADAHARGVVHRDLKPANLFLVERSDGLSQLKILDFGVAKSMTGLRLTADNLVLGSPRYMSPEQLASSREVDARTDIWALGAIGFRLLTDAAPFEDAGVEQQLVARLAGKRKKLRELRPELDADFAAVIERCLEPNKEARLQNVGELARALAPFGPAGSIERAARVGRASAPPPPDTAATVPLAARPSRLEPTLDEPVAIEPKIASGSPQPTSWPPPGSVPPRPSSSAALKYAVIGGIVTAAAILVAAVSGVMGMLAGLVTPREYRETGLQGASPSALDPLDALGGAKRLALELSPNAELVHVEIAEPVSGGFADVTAGARVYFEFEYSSPDGEDGVVIVQALGSKLLGSRSSLPRTRRPVPDPRCGTQRAWAAAVASGVPADARARFEYGKRPGVGTWLVEVPGRPELSRELDGQSCALVRQLGGPSE